MMSATPKSFRVRSFVGRNGRRTTAQNWALDELGPKFSLKLENGKLDYAHLFNREAERFLEIGFGTGQSLLALAKKHPERDFIGVETHLPGVGSLLLGVSMQQLTNVRVFNNDIIDVLETCIPEESLDGVNIFFPDPWQKRRHHARRLIQPAFIKLILSKLKKKGSLHLATDWEDYAHHMMTVLSMEPLLFNQAGVGQFASRSPFRPIETKFEKRALREGRAIWELQFIHQ